MYGPPRALRFSTWAVLAVMWHLAPEGTSTGTAEEIARDLHAWLADQDSPWRRSQGSLLVAPAAEGLSLAAPLQQHPDKSARLFLQTGMLPAALLDSEWRGTRGRHTRCRKARSSHCGTCPQTPWSMPPKHSKGPSRRPNLPA